jgi:hypothetical protein
MTASHWQMTWFINIGDDIQRDQKIKFPFVRSIDQDYTPSILVFTETLYQCADSYVEFAYTISACFKLGLLTINTYYRHAPRHFTKGDKIGINCEFVVDLRSVSSDLFARSWDKEGKP